MWTNLQFPADLVIFTEEILNGKIHFLYSVKDLSFCKLLIVIKSSRRKVFVLIFIISSITISKSEQVLVGLKFKMNLKMYVFQNLSLSSDCSCNYTRKYIFCKSNGPGNIMFSCEVSDIVKNIIFYRTLSVAASETPYLT